MMVMIMVAMMMVMMLIVNCSMSRPYGLVVGQGGKGTTISSLVDGGHPLRRYCGQGSSGLKRTLITCRSYGENVVYTDWKKDNYFRAIKVVIHNITSHKKLSQLT